MFKNATEATSNILVTMATRLSRASVSAAAAGYEISLCYPRAGASNKWGVGKISSFFIFKREYLEYGISYTAKVTIND